MANTNLAALDAAFTAAATGAFMDTSSGAGVTEQTPDSTVVALRVGGQRFETTLGTLRKYPDSLLGLCVCVCACALSRPHECRSLAILYPILVRRRCSFLLRLSILYSFSRSAKTSMNKGDCVAHVCFEKPSAHHFLMIAKIKRILMQGRCSVGGIRRRGW